MVWAAVIPIIGQVLDKVLPDPQAAADAKLKVLELAQRGELAQLDADTKLSLGQIEVNKVEAASDSLFKSGWRPGAGWACVAGLVYQVLFRPLFGWVATNMWGWSDPPSLEMETLMTLLFGLLGLGAYRSFEKTRKCSPKTNSCTWPLAPSWLPGRLPCRSHRYLSGSRWSSRRALPA
jgi:hypothetical protein